MAGLNRRGFLTAVGAAAVGAAGARTVVDLRDPASVNVAARASATARTSNTAITTGTRGTTGTPATTATTATSATPTVRPLPRPGPAGHRGGPRQPGLVVPVIRREGWGAKPAQVRRMHRHTPRRLTLHHTAVVLTSDSLAPARLRQHQSWHMDNPDNNFPDIVYHFMVDQLGNVYEGRDWQYRGDTATTYNTDGHFLVCCEGDFNRQKPTSAQLDSVAAVFAWAAQKWGIAPRLLAGHQDYAKTSCPGKSLEKHVKDRAFRVGIRELTQEREVRLEYLSVTASRRAVRAIERV